MFINKRLIGLSPQSKKQVINMVFYKWINLVGSIIFIFTIAHLFERLYSRNVDGGLILVSFSVMLAVLFVRSICISLEIKAGHISSSFIKKKLRSLIYNKIISLGPSYNDEIQSSKILQVTVEGVDQLENYFSQYLPQFFYALIAPVTLFVVLAFTVSIKASLVLFVCVPLIPIVIAVIQTIAKKLLGKYWGKYTNLGALFLENIEGLTTLKIYSSDKAKHAQMNNEAESFRKVTMRVLTMQLNSIFIMDFVAYGGAALGIVVAILQFASGNQSIAGIIAFVLLSFEFFIPMRRLGSYFHVAMNGIAASETLFALLDREVPNKTCDEIAWADDHSVSVKNLSFSYDGERQVLKNISIECPSSAMTAIVGESGSGKSTIAHLIVQSNPHDVYYTGAHSFVFSGSVRENLLYAYGDDGADIHEKNVHDIEEKMWHVLEQVQLAPFLKNQQGLDTIILEGGSNISGGQKQRLALARAMLSNRNVYIFDEPTSAIDAESEKNIIACIEQISKEKTVILITHRMAHVQAAKNLYVLKNGELADKALYDELCAVQKDLEKYVS